MHPVFPRTMLATAIEDCKDDEDDICYFGTHPLYLTEDLGETWRQIAVNVKQFDWAYPYNMIMSSIPEARIVALIRTPSQDMLVKTDDYFGNKTALVSNCLEYKLRSHFMFAIKAFKGDEVHLLVSTLNDNL